MKDEPWLVWTPKGGVAYHSLMAHRQFVDQGDEMEFCGSLASISEKQLLVNWPLITSRLSANELAKGTCGSSASNLGKQLMINRFLDIILALRL